MLESLAIVVIIVAVFIGLPILLYRRHGWNLFSDAITQLMQMFR